MVMRVSGHFVHELRRMFEFSFIAADSKGLSVSRPARD